MINTLKLRIENSWKITLDMILLETGYILFISNCEKKVWTVMVINSSNINDTTKYLLLTTNYHDKWRWTSRFWLEKRHKFVIS